MCSVCSMLMCLLDGQTSKGKQHASLVFERLGKWGRSMALTTYRRSKHSQFSKAVERRRRRRRRRSIFIFDSFPAIIILLAHLFLQFGFEVSLRKNLENKEQTDRRSNGQDAPFILYNLNTSTHASGSNHRHFFLFCLLLLFSLTKKEQE